jgi:hypothetical protein
MNQLCISIAADACGAGACDFIFDCLPLWALHFALQVIPQRTLSLEADTEAQAKVLWCLRTLHFRDAALEAALAQIIPNVHELLEG